MAGGDSEHDKIWLSVPHMSGRERDLVNEAFDANWIAPAGPHIDAFEREFARAVGADHAVALASGTAALHLALIEAGVGPGDTVLASTFTFVATATPIVYVGATPVFVDCDRASWNMDPELLDDELSRRAKANTLPRAVIVAHIYGQCADLDPIAASCARHGVTLIEDAAEALGATYRGRAPGTVGHSGIYSFNGNKIITTSSGGMLVSSDAELSAHAKKLSTQAREPVVHYEHKEIGFNYRMSNVCAGIGRAQLEVLSDRVAQRRAVFERYRAGLGDLCGIEFMPEAEYGTHTRWLTVVTINPASFGCSKDDVAAALRQANIESRPAWKPMHCQPVFAGAETVGGAVAESLFDVALCLPSSSSLTHAQVDRVIEAVRSCARG